MKKKVESDKGLEALMFIFDKSKTEMMQILDDTNKDLQAIIKAEFEQARAKFNNKPE